MQFYVYVYLDEDYCPTYVGKGCGGRCYQRRSIPIPPSERIKLQYFDTEQDAYQQEKNLIKFWGRKGIDINGLLLNVCTGGPGVPGLTGKLAPGYGKTGKLHPMYGRRGHLAPNYGKKVSPKTRSLMAEASSKQWLVTSPEGITQVIKNMRSFCCDHSLSPAHMTEVAQGKRKHHKGYVCRYA